MGPDNNNLSANLGPRAPITQIPNPLSNGNLVQNHFMAMPNPGPQNHLNMITSFQQHSMGIPDPMAQNSTGNGSPIRHQHMAFYNLTLQNSYANGNPFGNDDSPILNNPLHCPAEDAVGIHGRQMSTVMASEPFNNGYFTQNEAVGMQGLLSQDVMNDNGFPDLCVNLFPQKQVHLDPGFTDFQGFPQIDAQGGSLLPQGQWNTNSGEAQAQKAVNKLRAKLQTYQDKVSLLVQEHGKKVAALQQQVDTLKREKETLTRENVVVKSFYNMLKGHYDFMIGPEGRLFPIIPDTKERAVLGLNKPKSPLQQAYDSKMQQLKREYSEAIFKADICYLCPEHHGKELKLLAPQVERAALQFIDLTGDDQEPGPTFLKDSIQKFLSRAAQEEVLGSSSRDKQTITQVDATTPVQETATSESTTITAALPSATQAASINGGSTQSLATGSTKRPAPPVTPPSEVEDAFLSKHQKRKQSEYGWMQPSQNIALRKATGDLPHPLEEWSFKQAAGAAAGVSIREVVATYNVATTVPTANHQSSISAPTPEPAAPSASAAPKPSKASRVTKTKPGTPKKSNTRGRSRAKPKSSAALSAALTNALAGFNSATSTAAKISGNSSSYNALSVDILPDEPTHFPARRPTPPIPPTASPADIDPEYETEEERAARMRDYDLMVIDHNDQYPLPDDGDMPQSAPFTDADDEDVADIIALLEEPDEHDNQQNKSSQAKDIESDGVENGLAQDTAKATGDVEKEASNDKAGGGDENWDVDSLFGDTEEDIQVPWHDEESEVSEEE
ncbi:hypothetical protein CLAIMM_13080 [Cladophialophora immunda]|nr:hypothetical protein CLAIMM_13080 [Cladophialophora immunda]